MGGGRDLSGCTGTGDAAALRFVDELLDAGFDFFTGVPCSLVAPVVRELERRDLYFGETREDAALGLAAGAYLGGKLPVVIMQNSGVGVSLNALGSLHLLYGMPCLLVLTWRGFEGEDAPEHLVMGDVMTQILELFGIRYRVPEGAGEFEDDAFWAKVATLETKRPVAIVIKPGTFT